jgi:hypothetical protein
MGSKTEQEEAAVAAPPVSAFLLTRAEKGALTATFAGWTLDGMDVMAYSLSCLH